MRTLHVLELALELIDELRPKIAEIRRHDSDLAKQMKRAASSMVLNIGEGMHSYGRNAKVRYGTAAGSTSETFVALRLASAWGYLAEDDVKAVSGTFDSILAMLWKLGH